MRAAGQFETNDILGIKIGALIANVAQATTLFGGKIDRTTR